MFRVSTGGGEVYISKTGVLLVIQKIPWDYNYDDVYFCIFYVQITKNASI